MGDTGTFWDAAIDQLKPQTVDIASYYKDTMRPGQMIPDGAWRVWMMVAGRGWGKTWAAAWHTIQKVADGEWRYPAFVGPTAADVRDTMIEGPAGVLALSPPDFMPIYEPSKRRLTWPNRTRATLYSADEPDRLRGGNHDGAWCDELRNWKRGQESWDNLMMTLRIGVNPRAIVSTTPKMLKWITKIRDGESTVVTGGSTYENMENLSEKWRDQIIDRYEGTRLGRQELHAEWMESPAGAMWTGETLDKTRVRRAPDMVMITVGVDPSGNIGEEGSETGIIVVGKGMNGHGYVFADNTCMGSPMEWGHAVRDAYHINRGDKVVAERNFGGEMVRYTIQSVDPFIPVELVTASRGKRPRAEPIAALFEQGRMHIVGEMPELEDQLTSWTPEETESPDRLDAMVWAATDIFLQTHIPMIGRAGVTPNMVF